MANPSEVLTPYYANVTGSTVTVGAPFIPRDFGPPGTQTVSSPNSSPIIYGQEHITVAGESDTNIYEGTLSNSSGTVIGFLVYDKSNNRYFIFSTSPLPSGKLKLTFHKSSGQNDPNPTNWDLNSSGPVSYCFLRGTMLQTPIGETTVESLNIGDFVSTADGRDIPVTWVGHWTADVDAAPNTENLRPVLITASALGDGVPYRDLYVSPDHGIYLDGSLIPARLLINGTSITQPERAGTVEYFHIQVEPHDILLAEGAAAESYLDIGNISFTKSGEEPRSWEDACAPLLMAGPKLKRIRERLAGRVQQTA